VTRDATQRLIQDYLDGRLPDEERSRFETRLKREPELAAEVEALSKIGAALRAGDDELSPGFYTRARARFAEAQAPPARRWFRLLSWESAGLAAVVLIAAALFVPGLVMRRMPDGAELGFAQRKAPQAVLTEAGEIAATEPRTATRERDDVIEEDRFAEPSIESADEVGKQVVREKKGAPPAKAKIDAAEPESRVKEQPTDAKNEQWAPAPSAQVMKDRAEGPPEQEGVVAHAAGPRDKGSTATPPVEEQKRRSEKSARAEDARYAADELDEELRQADRPAPTGAGAGADRSGPLEAAASSAQWVPGTLLPYGVVQPGTVRIVESEQEWSTLSPSSARDAVAEGLTYDATRRALLIGSRRVPFECRWISVTRDEASYRVRLLPPAEDGLPAEHGCMIVLPRDEREIVVDFSAGFE
jgi:hypothetical protein